MTVVVNIFAGPGAGKSTVAAGLFYSLKKLGVEVELVTEYAKDRVWEGHDSIFGNQIYLFGKQYNRIFRLMDKVDVIVTDSPILLSAHYGNSMSKAFKDLVLEKHFELNSYNIFLKRDVDIDYKEEGRLHALDEAISIDREVELLLKENDISYDDAYVGPRVVEDILYHIGMSDGF